MALAGSADAQGTNRKARLVVVGLTETWAAGVEREAAVATAQVPGDQVVPWMATPGDMPVPETMVHPETRQERAAAAPAEAAPGEPVEPLTPAADRSFMALPDNGSVIPPDTEGSAGPNHLLTALNDRIRIQDKNGTVLSTTTLLSFWSSLGVSDVFDPKSIYDPNSGRFLFVTCATRRSANSGMLFAVSATSDPTGVWYKFLLDGDASNVNWVDYPNLGVNKNWITFTANMFTIAADAFSGVNVWAVDKATALAGGPLTTTLFFRTGEGGTLVPCLTYSNTEETQHIASAWSSSGYLRLFKITGTGPAPVFTATSLYPSSTPWNWTLPDADQLGSSQRIETNDPRLMNAVLRNGVLWCAHTVGLPASSATRTSAKWWAINPVTGSTVQSGVIDDPSTPTFYYYPTIAVNKHDEVLVGFTASSANMYAGACYTFRGPGDPAGTMQAVALLKAGENPYYKIYSGSQNRWGDYSATMVDPTDDAAFWTIQEYAYSPANMWSTWWGRIPSVVQTQPERCSSSPRPTRRPRTGEACGSTSAAPTARMGLRALATPPPTEARQRDWTTRRRQARSVGWTATRRTSISTSQSRTTLSMRTRRRSRLR
jgi:hypothetical protein